MTDHGERDRLTRSAEQTAFVGALCWHVPELLPLMQDNLDDYDGLLPHLLMGEVTRWVEAKFREDPANKSLRSALDFMEESFARGTNDTQEIIAVSFLENLPHRGEADFEVRFLLGTHLQAELKIVKEDL